MNISIIVPVYNVLPYLRRCLDSIVGQTFADWECILVDDGSTDGSGVICDEYARMDSRFSVIHQNNSGVAMARKAGVERACGIYSIHVDSDDYIDKDMLSDMYQKIIASDSDILVVDFYVETISGNRICSRQCLSSFTSEGIFEDIMSCKMHGSLCNKMLRHSCYKKYNIQFYPGINYCEDELVCVQLSKYPLKADYLPKAYYHYVSNPESITGFLSRERYDLRKKYVEKLVSLGVPMKNILLKSYMIKIEFMRGGLLKRDDFYGFYPPDLKTIFAVKGLPLRLFGFLSCCGCFYSGVFAYKVASWMIRQKVKLKRKLTCWIS